jgi:hypothetical protein
MKMNSGDKFNVVIAFEVSALLCWSDLISFIGQGAVAAPPNGASKTEKGLRKGMKG